MKIESKSSPSRDILGIDSKTCKLKLVDWVSKAVREDLVDDWKRSCRTKINIWWI